MPGKINSLTEQEQKHYLENTFGIEEITMEEDVQHICPLGEQIGVTHYDIVIKPGKQLAELVQLHWDIQDLMGKTFTLESGAAMVLQILRNHYVDALGIIVTASCKTNRHMAVKVTVSDYVR